MTLTLVETERKLDVGAGAKAEDGFTSLDVTPYFRPDVLAVAAALPFADDVFGEVRCWHVLEHLPRTDLIPAMNEMWRVLKPDGLIDIELPVFPYWSAMADPTHISFYVPQTFDYFCDTKLYGDHMKLYGIKPWAHRSRQRLMDGQILHVQMTKVAE